MTDVSVRYCPTHPAPRPWRRLNLAGVRRALRALKPEPGDRPRRS